MQRYSLSGENVQARSQSFRYFINISDFRARRSPRRQAFRIPFGYSRPEKPSLIRTLASPKTLPLGKTQVNLLLPSLIRTLASPKTLPLGKTQVNLLLPSLIRTLASPKTLSLGKTQVNLLLPSLIRNFGCTEDTPPRKKCKRACFFLSAYSYLCRLKKNYEPEKWHWKSSKPCSAASA